MTIKRVLLKYDKGTGALISEYEVKGLDLNELQALFGESSTDPMYHSYDVSEIQKTALEKATGVMIDLSRYDYCLDVYSMS